MYHALASTLHNTQIVIKAMTSNIKITFRTQSIYNNYSFVFNFVYCVVLKIY